MAFSVPTRFTLAAATAVMVAALGLTVAFAQSAQKVVTLTGAAESTPVTTTATGTFTYSVTGTSIEWSLQATGTDLTAAHIHNGAAGAAGPIVVNLFANANGTTTIDATGTATAAELLGPLQGKTFADFVTALNAGNLYANVHSKANAAGEIRGQLVAVSLPAAPSTGTGLADDTSSAVPSWFLAAAVAITTLGLALGAVTVARRRE
ncbi:MAG: CHRD domain-containing protein [Chloroflexi bacterium]|nr:CHRD domain-containing protein [Chloroflexota bacterium]